MIEILADPNTLEKEYIIDPKSISLPTNSKNTGTLKIRAYGNYLIVMSEVFDRLYTFKFCDYKSYTLDYLNYGACKPCDTGAYSLNIQAANCELSPKYIKDSVVKDKFEYIDILENGKGVSSIILIICVILLVFGIFTTIILCTLLCKRKKCLCFKNNIVV